MSVLDRRRFLTGGAVAAAFATSTQLGAVISETVPLDTKAQLLFDVMTSYNPDIDEEICREISNRYADYKVSPAQSLAAGAAAGATYGYLELRASDEPGERNTNTFYDKIAVALGIPFLTDNMMAPFFAGLPDLNAVHQNIASEYGERLNPQQAERVTMTVASYLMEQQYGSPGFIPALFTAFWKESLENYLDRHDVHVDNQGRGPN